jgi:hypothetical protein
VLVILTPQAMTDATATAEQLKPFAKLDGKPILASWMGGPTVDAGEAILNSVGIPTFKYPDRAARAFDLMWRYSENLCSIYEATVFAPLFVAADLRLTSRSGDKQLEPPHVGSYKQKVDAVISAARKAGRTGRSRVGPGCYYRRWGCRLRLRWRQHRH